MHLVWLIRMPHYRTAAESLPGIRQQYPVVCETYENLVAITSASDYYMETSVASSVSETLAFKLKGRPIGTNALVLNLRNALLCLDILYPSFTLKVSRKSPPDEAIGRSCGITALAIQAVSRHISRTN